MTPQIRKLLLVRHGLPNYRDGKAGDEPPGPSLSEVGAAQARQAAEVLKHYKMAAIYSSPLARARQTADRIRAALRVPLFIDSELKEWHRTESLYDVSQRSARWLVRWLAGPQLGAVVVGHASPLLAILRTALYLPHVAWHETGQPDQLLLSSCDRLELSMASVCALTVEAHQVTAELVFHPHPRVMGTYHRPFLRCLPRPVLGSGENKFVRRPNFIHLSGYHLAAQA